MMNIDVEQCLTEMAARLQQLIQQRGIDSPLMVGIHTGGVWVAQRLYDKLQLKEAMGSLDISFYRDDFTRVGMHPEVKPSKLPITIEDRHIILVDDVLHTGRTIRAALNELFDYGRPASITLAVLIERDGRELPIEASVVGRKIELQEHQHIKLEGPENLQLVVQEGE